MADKQAVLRERIADLISFERRLKSQLQSDADRFEQYSSVIELLASATEAASARGKALTQYLGAENPVQGHDPVLDALSVRFAAPSLRLKRLMATVAAGLAGYAELTELAFRLYDPPLRELAPRHLKACAALLHATARLIPEVTSGELAGDTLFCHCVCPMCGLGACACIEVGRQNIEAAWREACAAAVVQPFVLDTPRPGSPLAFAGVERGDFLLAVDGQEVRTIPEIQALIRTHPIGGNVLLRIGRRGLTSHEITVPHTSDNPKR